MNIPYGYCQCGCGEKTKIAKKSDRTRNHIKDEPFRFIHNHHRRIQQNGSDHPMWKGGVTSSRGYIEIWKPDHPMAKKNKRIRQSRLIVEKALGKILHRNLIVHHFDGNQDNDTPGNLIPCENAEYHMLLHTRQKAYEACGNPNFRRCKYCRIYDHPLNLYIAPNQPWNSYHKKCQSENYYKNKGRKDGNTSC